MSEEVKSNPSGLSPALIIVIVVAVIFCCLCVLCSVVTVWVFNNADFYIGDWEFWSGLIKLIG